MSSDLHTRMVDFRHDDADRGELMRKVWAPTPWMVDAWTGGYPDGREREMLEWCFETFGPESSPIHDREGRWHRGNATVFGWTWFGFSTENEMRQFEKRWPAPAHALDKLHCRSA